MNYKIYGIKITQDKVWLKSVEEHEKAIRVKWEIDEELTDKLNKTNKTEVIKEILYRYYTGTYRGEVGNYQQSVILVGDLSNIKSKERIKDILYDGYVRYQNRKKKPCVLTFEQEGKKYFFKKRLSRTKDNRVMVTEKEEEAKVFDSEEEMEYFKRQLFSGKNGITLSIHH